MFSGLRTIFIIALALLSGCGAENAATVVRGTVTMNDKPVASGGIFFLQAGAAQLGGPLKSDGTYEYSLPVGEYQVRIDAPAPVPASHRDGDPLPQLPRIVPEKFASFLSSGLTLAVTPESPQHADFKLP